jgi:hypothetical protein
MNGFAYEISLVSRIAYTLALLELGVVEWSAHRDGDAVHESACLVGVSRNDPRRAFAECRVRSQALPTAPDLAYIACAPHQRRRADHLTGDRNAEVSHRRIVQP